ncbi:hypothetical protein BH11MYX1_BH11MYX1_18300 [soil metagenome]
MKAGAAAVGIAIVAVHAIAFVAASQHLSGHELVVEVSSPLASPVLTLAGTVPAAIRSRVVETVDGRGPGIRRERWRVAYRGGHARQVGASQLVGPFQDQQACSGRVVVGQAMLDQVAVAMREMLDQQLRGEEVFPIGAYQKLEAFELQWAQFAFHPLDAGLLGAGAPHGYVRATARIVFDRVTVPLILVAIPEQSPRPGSDQQLHFRVEARAAVEVGNRALQWLNSHVELASRLATRIANHEIDAMLVTALAPPPPFELDRDQALAFTFCKDPVEIVNRAYGALPFAVRLGRAPPGIMPPHFVAPHTAPVAPTALAIDLDVDALNALFFELWRTGWLDKRLAEVGLEKRFNTDPTVTEFLTVRLSPLRLALPPVISPASDHLELAADARVNLADGGTTVGRVFGSLQFRFSGMKANIKLGALELACERSPTTLVPCYADLVAALADRGGEFEGALTDAFTALLNSIFVDRALGVGDLPGTLAIHGVTPSLAPGAATLHLDLDATLMR